MIQPTGVWRDHALRLRSVARLGTVLISIDVNNARRLSLTPTWIPGGDRRLVLAETVLHAGLTLAQDAFQEGPRLLGSPPYPQDDPSFQPPPARAHVLGASLWSAAVSSAARDEKIQGTVSALSGVMGEPLTPDAHYVRLRLRDAKTGAMEPTYEAVLQYSIAPQSKSATPAAVLVTSGAEEDVFTGPMTAAMIETYTELENVLLQAVAAELDMYRLQTRSDEERILQNR